MDKRCVGQGVVIKSVNHSPLSHSVLPCVVSKGFEVRLNPFDTEHSSLWKLCLFFTAGNPEIQKLNKAFV